MVPDKNLYVYFYLDRVYGIISGIHRRMNNLSRRTPHEKLITER